MKIDLQLFVSTYSTTHEKTEQDTTGGSQSSTQGGSHSSTQGGSHSSTITNNAAGTVDKNTQQKYDEYKQGYQASQDVQKAKDYLQGILDKQPNGFQSNYTDELNRLYNQVTNGEKFSYDMNSDVLYQQYKNIYERNGQKAMQDTLGQASALTGGYNSSYAQTAAQQTYNNYLGELNDKVPELYEMAYDKYRDQQDALYQQFTMASDMYGKDYTQYRDTVADWQSDRDYASNMYENERNFDYNDYQNMLDFWQNEYWNQKHSVSTSETDESYWSTTDESSWSNTNESNWSHTSGSATSSTNSNGGSGSSDGSGNNDSTSGTGRVTTLKQAQVYAEQNNIAAELMTYNEFKENTAMREWFGSDQEAYIKYLNYTCGIGV